MTSFLGDHEVDCEVRLTTRFQILYLRTDVPFIPGTASKWRDLPSLSLDRYESSNKLRDFADATADRP